MKTLQPPAEMTGPERTIALACLTLAEHLYDCLGDGPEFSAGLRKLREAQQCFVLQSLFDQAKTPEFTQ
jgi:hypothetical protein